MRALLLLLVMANALVWAWTQGLFGHSPSPDAARMKNEVAAGSLTIVSRNEPPPHEAAQAPSPGAGVESSLLSPESSSATPSLALSEMATSTSSPLSSSVPPSSPALPPPPASSPPSPPSQVVLHAPTTTTDEPTQCRSWPLPEAGQVKKLRKQITEEFPRLKLHEKAAAPVSQYWVYFAPRANRTEAEKKVEEIKALGVSEYFIVQDSVTYRDAISLGVFSSESAANERLTSLQAKGVKTAKIGPYPPGKSTGKLNIEGPLADIRTAQGKIPALKEKSSACHE